jgi:hypothetical protein
MIDETIGTEILNFVSEVHDVSIPTCSSGTPPIHSISEIRHPESRVSWVHFYFEDPRPRYVARKILFP